MTKIAYTVREALREDIAPLLALYNEAFPDTNKTREWWEWWFLENPGGPSLQVVAETPEGKLIGMHGSSPWRLCRRGEITVVSLSQTGVIDPGYQRMGIFKALGTQLHERLALRHPIDFGLPNVRARNAYVKNLGYEHLGDASFHTLEAPAAVRNLPYRLEPMREFGPEHDALWERCKSRIPIAQVRDAKYLNWRFVFSRMGKEYRLFDVRDGSGELSGYLVAQPFRDKLDLLDCLLDRGKGLGDPRMMLELFETLAANQGFRRASAWTLDSHADVTELLSQRGYRKDERLFYFCIKRLRDEDACNDLWDLNSWNLTAGDLELF